MNTEKRRPTLEELKALPQQLWWLEAAQIAVDAAIIGALGMEIEATNLMDDPDLTPEKIVELREKLQRATGSTKEEAA